MMEDRFASDVVKLFWSVQDCAIAVIRHEVEQSLFSPQLIDRRPGPNIEAEPVGAAAGVSSTVYLKKAKITFFYFNLD